MDPVSPENAKPEKQQKKVKFPLHNASNFRDLLLSFDRFVNNTVDFDTVEFRR